MGFSNDRKDDPKTLDYIYQVKDDLFIYKT